MSGYTEPCYSAPIVVAGTETILVNMTAGSTSGDFTATLTAGTYYNHATSAGSFAAMVATQLSTADVAVNAAVGASNWTVATPAAGLTFRLGFTRSGGQASDEIEDITFTGFGEETHLGIAGGNPLSPGAELVNNIGDDNSTMTALYQRGYVWLPREILTFDTQIPKGTRAVASTNYGSAVVDGYGSYRRRVQKIEYVKGAAVYIDKATDAQSLGFASAITSMTAGDSNVPLETFWGILGGNSGAAPVVKYIPDSTALGTTQDMVFADSGWLEDMDAVAEVMSESPLLYRVTMRGQESV